MTITQLAVPTDELAEDAYRVVRDALRMTEKVGIGQLSMRGKEYLAAVKPCGDGLLLETLHYADELHKAAPLFASIEDKPQFASLRAGQSMHSITLEEALKLFELPRTLGEHDGVEHRAVAGGASSGHHDLRSMT